MIGTAAEGGISICLRPISQLDGSTFWQYGCGGTRDRRKGEGPVGCLDCPTEPDRRSIPRPDPETGDVDRRMTPEETAAGVTDEAGFLNAVKAFAVSDAGIFLAAALFIGGTAAVIWKGYRTRIVGAVSAG